MTSGQPPRRFWRYARGLAAPIVIWALLVSLLIWTFWWRGRGADSSDRSDMEEWIDESRPVRATLAEMVRHYLDGADPVAARRQIQLQLDALANPLKVYGGQLPKFPTVYRLELTFAAAPHGAASEIPPPIVWESEVPRARHSAQVQRMDYRLLGSNDGRAVLHIEYQLHAYNKRQRDEQAADFRLRWVSGLAIAATAVAFLWIYLVQRREREREQQRLLDQQQIDKARQLALENELRRQEAEYAHEEAKRKLLEQRLATQAAEGQALELKSQLYASIGIMAGSYAHNIKNLLVRPNDLLRRCLENDSLSTEQAYMLREVRQTLGTVTDRLQQILQTVRRDPSRSELARIDLNALVRDMQRTWSDLAQEKWKVVLSLEADAEPLWIEGDHSHLQQAVENLLFNARDATFEMRNYLREQAHHAGELDTPARRQALISAAAWKGTIVLRTRREAGRAILEVEDNGIGMTDEVRRRCTETHFSTKRNNAIYEGNSTGMGLGLSFVVAILEHHHARLEIESVPGKGTRFRVAFPTERQK